MRTHFYFVLLFEMQCCWVLAYIRHLFSSPEITLASSFVVIFFLRSHYDYFLVTVHLWVGVIFFFWRQLFFGILYLRTKEENQLCEQTGWIQIYCFWTLSHQHSALWENSLRAWGEKPSTWLTVHSVFCRLRSVSPLFSLLSYQTNYSRKSLHGTYEHLLIQQAFSSMILRILRVFITFSSHSTEIIL